MQENPYKSWLHHVIMFHPLVARPNCGRRSPSRNILWYLYPIQQWHCQAKFWLHDWLRHLPVDHFVDEVQQLHVRLLPEDHGSIKGRLLCHQVNFQTVSLQRGIQNGWAKKPSQQRRNENRTQLNCNFTGVRQTSQCLFQEFVCNLPSEKKIFFQLNATTNIALDRRMGGQRSVLRPVLKN